MELLEQVMTRALMSETSRGVRKLFRKWYP